MESMISIFVRLMIVLLSFSHLLIFFGLSCRSQLLSQASCQSDPTPLFDVFHGRQWLILGDLESPFILAWLQIVSRGDMPFKGLHARLAANHTGNLIRLERLLEGHGWSRRDCR